MAATTQVATQVTTKRLYNLMSGGQALMRSVYYSRQVSSSALWKKPHEVLGFLSRVGSKRWAGPSSMQEESEEVVLQEQKQPSEHNVESTAQQQETSTVSNTIPAATENSGKSYGAVQDDPHHVAHSTHEEWNSKEDDQERLETVNYDMSKVTRPSGGE